MAFCNKCVNIPALAQTLKDLRDNSDLSMEDLAQGIGISRLSLSKLEKCQVERINNVTLRKLLHYGIEVKYL